MIKLFVSDIDGTLFPKPGGYTLDIGGIRDEDLAAFQALEAAGIRVAIASGRHHTFLAQFPKHPTLILPTVGFNGGYVYLDGEIIYQNPFTREEIRQMIRDFPEAASGFCGCTVQNTWVYNTLEDCRRFYFRGRGTRIGFERIFPVSLEEYLADETNEPLAHVFFSLEPPHTVEEYEELINEKYKDSNLRAVITSQRSVDFLRGKDNKATGIGILAARLGISMDEVAVVGDAHNDIAMFQAAGRSFCIQGAAPEVLAAADTAVPDVAWAARLVLEEQGEGAVG